MSYVSRSRLDRAAYTVVGFAFGAMIGGIVALWLGFFLDFSGEQISASFLPGMGIFGVIVAGLTWVMSAKVEKGQVRRPLYHRIILSFLGALLGSFIGFAAAVVLLIDPLVTPALFEKGFDFIVGFFAIIAALFSWAASAWVKAGRVRRSLHHRLILTSIGAVFTGVIGLLIGLSWRIDLMPPMAGSNLIPMTLAIFFGVIAALLFWVVSAWRKAAV